MAKLQGDGWLQIGSSALTKAGIKTGDKLRIKADGRGRLVIECSARITNEQTSPQSDTRFDDFLSEIDSSQMDQPDLSALFPEQRGASESVSGEPDNGIARLDDYRPTAKPKRHRPNMNKVQVETKQAKRGRRRIGIPNAPGRKSTS